MELNRPLSRRDFLKILAAESVLLMAGACSPLDRAANQLPQQRAEKPKLYSGTIRNLQGREVASESELQGILQTLTDFKRPFWTKIANELQTLTTIRQRPADFPDWIEEASFPLTIVTNKSAVASAVTITASIKDLAYSVHSADNSAPSTHNTVAERSEYIALDLPLTNPYIEKAHPFIKAFLAAKELLTHLTKFAFMDDFYRISTEKGTLRYTDPQGNPINDPETRRSIGMTEFLKLAKDINNPVYKLVDQFPLLLMIPELKELARKSQLPKDFYTLLAYVPNTNFRLYDASSNQARADLTSIIDDWTPTSSLLLPPHTVDTLFHIDLFNLAMQTKTRP